MADKHINNDLINQELHNFLQLLQANNRETELKSNKESDYFAVPGNLSVIMSATEPSNSSIDKENSQDGNASIQSFPDTNKQQGLMDLFQTEFANLHQAIDRKNQEI